MRPLATSVVDLPEVRDEVDAEDLEEAPLRDGHANSASPDHDADVGDNELAAVVGAEHDGRRVEVCAIR